MLRNLVSLYLFGAVLLTSFFSTYFLSKSNARHVKIFSVFSFSMSVYILGYLHELNSYEIIQMAFWNQVQYFSIPFISTFMLIFTLLFTRKNFKIKITHWILLFTIPSLSFLIRLTNIFHNLYYKNMNIISLSGVNLLVLDKGPWYYVQQVHALSAILIAIVLLVGKIRTNRGSENSQYGILIIATFVPLFGIILILKNFLNNGLDYVAILLPASLLLITHVIFKYDFLEIKTKAREASFENNPDGIILMDTHFRIMDFNKAAASIFPELKNMKGASGIEKILDRRTDLISIFKSNLSDEFVLENELSDIHYDITSSDIHDSHGKPVGHIKILRDITEKNRIKEQMHKLATVDSLSGLFNRNHFFELAQKEFYKFNQSGDTLSFIMMDIDNFKLINDNWGHGAGDMVIREFGKLLKEIFHQYITGRVGGEEFAVILSVHGKDKAIILAEEFRVKFEKLKIKYDTSIISNTTVSSGVSFSDSSDKDIDDLLKKADKAMYLAKYNGRNRVEVNDYENLS